MSLARQVGHRRRRALAGTHWSYLPSLQAACVSSQPWSRSWRNCRPRLSSVGSERQDLACAAVAAGARPACRCGSVDRARVAEPAHAAQGAEVVVEGAVLLHQDDDVLDVVDGAGAVLAGIAARGRCWRGMKR